MFAKMKRQATSERKSNRSREELWSRDRTERQAIRFRHTQYNNNRCKRFALICPYLLRRQNNSNVDTQSISTPSVSISREVNPGLGTRDPSFRSLALSPVFQGIRWVGIRRCNKRDAEIQARKSNSPRAWLF